MRRSCNNFSGRRLPPPWWVSQTINSVTPAASAAALAELTSAVKSSRAAAATCSRTPLSQYHACSRVKIPLEPSMSQCMKILKPRFSWAASRVDPAVTLRNSRRESSTDIPPWVQGYSNTRDEAAAARALCPPRISALSSDLLTRDVEVSCHDLQVVH